MTISMRMIRHSDLSSYRSAESGDEFSVPSPFIVSETCLRLHKNAQQKLSRLEPFIDLLLKPEILTRADGQDRSNEEHCGSFELRSERKASDHGHETRFQDDQTQRSADTDA